MFDQLECLLASDESGLLSDDRERVVVKGVSWAGAYFDAVVQPHPEEVRRRGACGLGALTDVTTLAALSTLPVGNEVPWASLDPVVAAYLSGLDEGIVAVSPWGVTRLAEAPLRVACLVRFARHWRDIGRLGVFAPLVPTVLVLKHTPRDLDEAIGRACRAGVGLYVASPTFLRTLVAPSSRDELSTRRTRLIEVIYRRLLRQKAGTPAERNHPFNCLEAGCGRPS